jgi:hypothetical protein
VGGGVGLSALFLSTGVSAVAELVLCIWAVVNISGAGIAMTSPIKAVENTEVQWNGLRSD